MSPNDVIACFRLKYKKNTCLQTNNTRKLFSLLPYTFIYITLFFLNINLKLKNIKQLVAIRPKKK